MTATVHRLGKSLKNGENGKRFIREIIADSVEFLRAANDDEEHIGIDEWVRLLSTGRIYSVQYKTDFREALSHRVAFEMVAVEERHVRGWYYTCTADVILDYAAGADTLFGIWLPVHRPIIEHWRTRFRDDVPSYNERWTGRVMPVPTSEVKKHIPHVDLTGRVPHIPRPVKED